MFAHHTATHTCTSTTQVRLYAAPPPHTLSCEWEMAVDVSKLLKEHLMDTDWQVRGQPLQQKRCFAFACLVF